MSCYILIRVDDDFEADLLLRDLATQPHLPLLTPDTGRHVHVELVAELDTGDVRAFGIIPDPGAHTCAALAQAVIETYRRAGELAAAEWGAA